MTVLFDGFLDVHYGFFNLVSDIEAEPDVLAARRGQSNGLVGARLPYQLSFVTGLHTGRVPLRIEWSQVAPSLPGPEWEDAVEVSWEVANTELELAAFEDFRDVSVPQPGWHRVRYSAAAMQAGKDLDTADEDEDPPDRYLIELWPQPPAPDSVVREGSEIARYWHGVARGGG